MQINIIATFVAALIFGAGLIERAYPQECSRGDCIDEICEIVAQGITATAIFIDKCEHVGLFTYKLCTRKANKLFRSQFCIVTHLAKTPRVESRSELSVLFLERCGRATIESNSFACSPSSAIWISS